MANGGARSASRSQAQGPRGRPIGWLGKRQCYHFHHESKEG